MKLATQCPTLDKLLGGGIETSTITEFYGEAGSGKTNICLQLARNACKEGKKVVYIDTESISLERLKQICGKDFDKIVRNILFFRPYSLSEQERMVKNAVKIKGIGLIILDTINRYLRLAFYEDPNGCDKPILRMLDTLYQSAQKYDCPVVLTCQVYSREEGDIKPFGGRNIEYIAKTIIKLEKTGKGKRRAVLMKHRSMPEGETADFLLTGKGVEC